MFFSVQLIGQDQTKQKFELKIYNLGGKKEFSQFFNQMSCGSTIIVKQPYMTVNKQGYFMIRNDAISNIDYDKNYIVTPQFLYKQAELYYSNGQYEDALENFSQARHELDRYTPQVGPLISWKSLRDNLRVFDEPFDMKTQVLKILKRPDKLDLIKKMKQMHQEQHRYLKENTLPPLDEFDQFTAGVCFMKTLCFMSQDNWREAYDEIRGTVTLQPGNDQAIQINLKT